MIIPEQKNRFLDIIFELNKRTYFFRSIIYISKKNNQSTTIKDSIPQLFISIESTMKQATVLVLSLVILGATASPKRGGGHGGGGQRGPKKQLLKLCDIDRDFCDKGPPAIRPFVDGERDCSSYVGTTLERGDRPEREECTVGDRVICFRFKIKVRFHPYFFQF